MSVFWERLDTSRHEIVQLCGEKGMALFTFLLSSSMIMSEREDVAVFSNSRLSDVALQLGWSPDTVKRYVAVFRALNLVQHYHDQHREVTLHIPLGPYPHLTNFTGLDELMRTRKKQQQLARSVKTRYIMRFGDPTQAYSPEIHYELAELKAILDNEHLEPLKRQRLQIKIADLLIRAAGTRVGDLNHVLNTSEAVQERRLPDNVRDVGDSNGVQEVTSHTRVIRQGDLNHSTGDSLQQPSVSLSPIKQPLGDLNRKQGDKAHVLALASPSQPEQVGDLGRRMGDSKQPFPLRTDPLGDSKERMGDEACVIASASTPQSERLGDSKKRMGDPIPSPITPASKSTVTQAPPSEDRQEQMGDSKQPFPLQADTLGDEQERMGDSEELVDGLLTYNVNVNYIINNISKDNVIRKRLAQFLGEKLEDDRNAFKKYLHIFKQYESKIIGRAFISTMVLMHREHWSLDRPGGFFTAQCRALSGQANLKGYSENDVEEWLRLWGDLPYDDLLRALTAPPAAKLPPVPSSAVANRSTPASLMKNAENRSLPRIQQKRTYGMHYTGLAAGRPGFNSTGSLTPPHP